MTTPREEAVIFGGERGLVGVITDPPPGARGAGKGLGVIVLNAGITPRIGPSRLSVRLARALALQGLTTLRFDHSQTGDSKLARRGPGARDVSQLDVETVAALDHLHACRGLDRFVLTGLCAGAAGALRAARQDRRVVAAVPIGLPPIRGAGGPRLLLRHFLRLAFRSSFRARKWRAMASLDFDVKRVLGTLVAAPFSRSATTTGVMPDARGELRPLLLRGTELLIVHAEGDEGLDATLATVDPELLRPVGRPPRLHIVRGANHVFTLASNQAELLQLLVPWMAALPERLAERADAPETPDVPDAQRDTPGS